jgi:CBS domain-containing protein
VISERDYMCKIALLGRTSRDTKVKEISTKTANLFTASPSDSIEMCMNKMLMRDIRHLPMLDESGKCVGMVSVKDLVKSVVAEKEKQVEQLANFALGKGGHFTQD